LAGLAVTVRGGKTARSLGHFRWFSQDHPFKDYLKGHTVTASSASFEEITVTLPFTVLVLHCVWIILASKCHREGLEVDPVAFLGITLGFLDFSDHSIIHRLFLLSRG
jgi:hypothetical protein